MRTQKKVSVNKCAAAILAGGKSLRMGRDKSLLQIGDKTLLQYVKENLSSTELDEIYISSYHAIADNIPHRGPLSGVHAILKQTQGRHKHLIVVPVDMPCLTSSVIDKLINAPLDKTLVHYNSYIMPFRIAIEERFFKLADNLLRDGRDVSLKYFQTQIKNKLVLDVKPSDESTFQKHQYTKTVAKFYR